MLDGADMKTTEFPEWLIKLVKDASHNGGGIELRYRQGEIEIIQIKRKKIS